MSEVSSWNVPGTPKIKGWDLFCVSIISSLKNDVRNDSEEGRS